MPRTGFAPARPPQPERKTRAIGPEDHILAMLLREPDLLVLLTERMEQLAVAPPNARDFLRKYQDGDFRCKFGAPTMSIPELQALGDAAGW